MRFRFADIPVVDGHIHFTDVDQMDEILRIRDTVPMTKVNLLSVPHPEMVNQNPALMAFKARYPDITYLSGGLDYTQVAAEDWSTVDPTAMSENLGHQIGTLRTIGFDGLKLIEGKPTVRKRTINISRDLCLYAESCFHARSVIENLLKSFHQIIPCFKRPVVGVYSIVINGFISFGITTA